MVVPVIVVVGVCPLLSPAKTPPPPWLAELPVIVHSAIDSVPP